MCIRDRYNTVMLSGLRHMFVCLRTYRRRLLNKNMLTGSKKLYRLFLVKNIWCSYINRIYIISGRKRIYSDVSAAGSDSCLLYTSRCV